MFKTLVGVSATVATRFIGSGVQFAVSILIGSRLTAADFGVFSYYAAVGNVLMTASLLGLDTLILRDGDRVGRDASSSQGGAVKASILLFSAVFGLITLVYAGIQIRSTSSIGVVLALAYGFRGISTLVRSALYSESKNTTELAFTVVEGALVVGLLYLTTAPLGLVALLYAAGYGVGMLLRLPSINWRQALTVRTVSLLQHSKYFAMNSVFSVLYLNLDTLLLWHIATQEAVGYYQAALKIIMVLYLIPEAAATALLPRIARAHERGKSHGAAMFAVGGALLTGALLAMGVWGSRQWLVTSLFGPAYFPSVALLQIAALGLPFRYANFVLGAVLYATHRQKTRFTSTVISALMSSAGILTLGRVWGTTGVITTRVLVDIILAISWTLIVFRGMRKRGDAAEEVGSRQVPASRSAESAKRVVITHCWANSNKGDLAIEKGIVQAVRIAMGGCRIQTVSTFGLGDRRLSTEYAFSNAMGLEVLPNLFPNPAVLPADQRGGAANRFGFLRRIVRLIRVAARLTGLQLRAWLLLFAARLDVGEYLLGEPQERQAYEAFKHADLIIVKGGAFLYAPPGVRGLLYAWRVAFPIQLARALGKRVIIAPHSFGPFKGGAATRHLARVLDGTDRICCRERISVETLKKIGVSESLIIHVPDMAFLLEASEFPEPLSSRGGLRIGLTVRPYGYFGRSTTQGHYRNYLQAIRDAIVELHGRHGAQFFLFPQVIGPEAREDDRVAIQDLWSALPPHLMEHVQRLNGDYSPEQLMAGYAGMDLIVGTRMHSVIFSAIGGVPGVAIAYFGPKHQGIMQDLGMEDYVLEVDSVTGPEIVERVERLLEKRDQLSKRVSKRAERFKAEIHDRFVGSMVVSDDASLSKGTL